jgi:hypothetical protein
MPYTIAWLVPQRVISFKQQQNLPVSEMKIIDQTLCSLLDEGQPKQVHLVVDMTEAAQLPGVYQFKEIKVLQHPNLGWEILCSNNQQIVRTLATLAARLFNVRLKMVNTQTEALHFLKTIDSSLVLPEESIS